MDIPMRSRIEFALAAGHSIRTIARDIGVSLSTVSREIRKHTYESFKGCYGRTNQCIHRADCRLSGVCGSSSLPKSKQVSQFITSVSQMPRCSHETPPPPKRAFIYIRNHSSTKTGRYRYGTLRIHRNRSLNY